MDFKEFTAGPDDNGRRIDKICRIFLCDTPLTEIYKLLRKGLIKLNHKKAKPEDRVSQGDVISIAEFLLNNQINKQISKVENVQDKAFAKASDLQIVFENEHLLIIDKPYDRTVHGKADGLYEDVQEYLSAKSNDKVSNSLSFRPGPLHRLDRRTTGLLVFSKSLEGARWFSESIKNHTIKKKYIGLAEGKLTKSELWQDKFAAAEQNKELNNEKAFYTVEENEEGLTAQTQATPLAYGKLNSKPVTLVEYSIKTGRKHQIRLQSSLHKHPLAGDTAYGGSKIKEAEREFYLQAYSLKFPSDNPLGLPEEVKIGYSSDFIRILQYCEIEKPGL